MTSQTAILSNATTSNLSRAGWVCFAGGLLGIAQGAFMLLIQPAVPFERFSYPLTPTGYVVAELTFAAQHLMLVVGLVALARSAWAARSRLARVGYWLATVALVLLAVVEVISLSAANASLTDPEAVLIVSLYGLPTLLAGAGLVLGGAGLARSSGLTGWRRWLPLTVGVWVFVPMLPAIFGPYAAGRLALIGWMALFAALGWMIARTEA
ncbi:MAG TPA: hypothetical protein VIT42_11250 [Microlunatus sp.]